MVCSKCGLTFEQPKLVQVVKLGAWCSESNTTLLSYHDSSSDLNAHDRNLDERSNV